jgi:hypothetical protein
MAKQTINIGTTANDGTGDQLRAAFDKSNDNFTELYTSGLLNLTSNNLSFQKADGTTSTVSLAAYLDEDARAIASGSLNSGTGILTFTRDDASTFNVDMSALLDDTNIVTQVNSQTGSVVLGTDNISEGSSNLYYTDSRVSANTAVAANTAKNSYPSADATKLAGIETGAQVNVSVAKTVAEITAVSNATTNSIALGATPTNKNFVDLFVSGVYQSKSNFAVSGSTLTLSSGNFPEGAHVETITTTN